MSSRMRRYTALGSSFAAGPGIPPIADPAAMRSSRNYPHLLAEALGLELTDLSVSGATTATILDEPQITPMGVRVPAQVHGLRSDADLVTITAGGNDLGYLGAMLFTAWRRVQPTSPMVLAMGAEYADGLPEPTVASVAGAASGLVGIVRRVRMRAPAARIVLVDYLTIVGPETAPTDDVPFEDADLDAFRRIQSGLERAFVSAAEASGAELVAVSAASRDHALGSPEPWVSGFIRAASATGGSFHPNADGMAAVAALLVDLLR